MRIQTEKRGAVLVIRLDDGKANAIGPDWCAELGTALDEAESDEISVVWLLGRDGFFSGGLDLKALPQLGPAEVGQAFKDFVSTMQRVFLFPKPVVAGSVGHAIAGGFMLFLAADYRIALDSDEHQYGLNEVRNGIPILGATAAICRCAVPAEYQTSVIQFSEMGKARSCHERKIVAELCSTREEVEAALFAKAETLLAVEREAYRATKIGLRSPYLVSSDLARSEARWVPSGGNPLARVAKN